MNNPTYDQYKKKAAEFAKNYQVTISDHILDIMVSVMMTRDKVMLGGSFVQAVVNNDLFSAVSRADQEVLEKPNFRIIVFTNQYCFL